MTERFITSTLNRRDAAKEVTLRPPSFAEFPGQERVKEQLELFVQAAKARNEALDHILLSGPPGLGKTTLAYIIANERGTNLKSSSGPAIENPATLPVCSPVWNPATCFLLTKSTGSAPPLKNIFTARWRIFSSISCWNRVQEPEVSVFQCRASPSSEQRPDRV